MVRVKWFILYKPNPDPEWVIHWKIETRANIKRRWGHPSYIFERERGVGTGLELRRYV